MKHASAQQLVALARRACEAVAEGPFTPIVLERYEFIDGERGWNLGFPTQAASGLGCIVWSNRAATGHQP